MTQTDVRRLAWEVLEHCRQELGLPHMTIHWVPLPNEWGMVEPEHPTILLLNTRLLGEPAQLVETCAHEARHAWRILIRGDDVFHLLAERDADHYGRRVAARWSDEL